MNQLKVRSKLAILFITVMVAGGTLSFLHTRDEVHPSIPIFPRQLVVGFFIPVEKEEPTIVEVIEEEPSSKSIPEEAVSLTQQEQIEQHILTVSSLYPSLEPELIHSIIWKESRYDPTAKNYNGTCIGLMQISTKWHTKRANSLGVTDLFDPYGNILTGCDLLSELLESYSLPMALMVYHGGYTYANNLYSQGIVDSYTSDILEHMSKMKGVT